MNNYPAINKKIIFLHLTIMFFIFSGNLFAQLASFPLDDNVSDTTLNKFEGTLLGNTSFVSENGREVLRFEEDSGALVIPEVLSQRLNDGSNYQISFDFNLALHSVNSQAIRPLVQQRSGCESEIQKCPGLGIMIWWIPPTQDYIVILNFSDGIQTANDYWYDIAHITPGEWNSLQFKINLDTGEWEMILNGTKFSNKINHLDSYNYDLKVIKENILNNQMVLGSNTATDNSESRPVMMLDNLEFYSPAPSPPELDSALVAFTKSLKGEIILSENEKSNNYNTIKTNFVPFFESSKNNILGYLSAYESINSPLFSSMTRVDISTLSYEDQLAILIMDNLIQNEFITGRLQYVTGLKFKEAELFPGTCSDTDPRIVSATVQLNATYNKNIAVPLTMDDFVVRPTGYWAPAGEKITLVFGNEAVNKGLSVVVGAHYRNITPDLETQNRMTDISTEFSVESNNVDVANPYGGGIYLKVPAGTDLSWINLEIKNAVKSPYYSYRKERKTDINDWIEQVSNTTVPWVDFESDQFMFTMPLNLAESIANPDQIMERWELIMTNIKELAGRTEKSARAEYYIRDRQLVTPAYGAGYPLTIPPSDLPDIPDLDRESDYGTWNPFRVLEYHPSFILFHEMGHNLLLPHMFFEDNLNFNAETIVHLHGFKIYNTIYDMSLDEAFQECSFQRLTIDQAAMDWMITYNFRNNLSIGFDPTIDKEINDQIRYQHRGLGIYGDLAKLYGWDGVAALNGRFYKSGIAPEGPSASKPFVYTRERFVNEACAALNTNVEPLFHFWGIKVSADQRDSLENQYSHSTQIDSLLLYYKSIIPRTQNEFINWHNQVYNLVGDVQQPRWDGIKNKFSKSISDSMIAQIDRILKITSDISGKNELGLVSEIELLQNYPNPFNPTTIIKYELPEISKVSLKVYDLLGREVAILVNEEKQAGRYDVTFNSSNLTSGVYFYRLQVGSFVQTKKMILMK